MVAIVSFLSNPRKSDPSFGAVSIGSHFIAQSPETETKEGGSMALGRSAVRHYAKYASREAWAWVGADVWPE